MKIGKIAFALAILSLGAFGFAQSDLFKTKSLMAQEVRRINYDQKFMGFDLEADFDEHELIENGDSFTLTAKKSFDASILEGLDLVALAEDAESFNCRYEVNYIDEKDTIFLSVILEGENENSIIDTVPGLPSYNENGEADIMFAVDDEIVWLSDINTDDPINETGWFKNLIKKVTKAVTNVAKKVAAALAPIIRPIVQFAIKATQFILGPELAAKLGAKVLNMYQTSDGVYHANFDCWQQYFGYADIYDIVFDCGTSMRAAKFPFDVNNDKKDDYILWAWKGDYLNLGAGAELGIYERWEYSDVVWKINKKNAMNMTLRLDYINKSTKAVERNIFNFQPTDKQWWITGFSYKNQNVNRDNLLATYTVTFTNQTWYNAFKGKYMTDSRWNFSKQNVPQLSF